MKEKYPKTFDFLKINKEENVEIFNTINELYKSLDKKAKSYKEISTFLKENKAKYSTFEYQERGKELFNKVDEGIIVLNNLQNKKDSIFKIKKSLIDKLNHLILSKLREADEEFNKVEFKQFNLMHYHRVKKPRPLHRDSKKIIQWKLFIPIAQVENKSSGQFWYIPNSSLNKNKRSFFNALIYDLSRIVRFPSKEIFNPIPYNFFLSNQNCLHGDKCINGPIYRSMLVFNYVEKLN